MPDIIVNSLQHQGLVAKAVRKFKATTNSHHNLPVLDYSATARFFSECTESEVGRRHYLLTYLLTDEGWLYLAVITDLFSRQVVDWSMAERMTTDLACDALRMAIFRRKRPKNVIVHSDRCTNIVPTLTDNCCNSTNCSAA